MKLIDLYYKAFRDFRKHTEKHKESEKERKLIVAANASDDLLTSTRHICIIEEDWVANIEEGLIYVEKALREERQFIRSEGEVVPIEKVKRTSKATVEHLAKHTGLITRQPKDGETLIPVKLFMVEKLSDYAVYENRFLYMLLCYLRDFVQMRIDKIRDKLTTFETQMKIDKKIKLTNRTVTYRLIYSDLHKNDPLLVESYKDIPMVNRIETIYAMISSFLQTPLMREVSKTPKIKPPVVKTNVLRMNQNFKASLKLYDFVASYTKDGYEFKEVKKRINPFTNDIADDVADSIELTSSLTYTYGHDIRAKLKDNYESEQRELIRKEREKEQEEIHRLKKRISELNEEPYEYILKLEKRNRNLEKDILEMLSIEEKNRELKERMERIEIENQEITFLLKDRDKTIEEKTRAYDLLNEKYYHDLEEAELLHKVELKNQENSFNEHLLEKEMAYKNEIEEIYDQKNKDIEAINLEHDEVKKIYQEKINGLNQVIQNKQKELVDFKGLHEQTKNDYNNEISKLNEQILRLEEEKRFVEGSYRALRYQNSMDIGGDFTTKETFAQLEIEMNAYKKLFKEEWKKAKEKIREDVRKSSSLRYQKMKEKENETKETEE